jgi:Zn-dependent M32 family carboxypeptidase
MADKEKQLTFRYRDLDRALKFLTEARDLLVTKYEKMLEEKSDSLSAKQIEQMISTLHKFIPVEINLIRESKKVRKELEDSSSVEEVVNILLTLDAKDIRKVERLVYKLLAKKQAERKPSKEVPKFSRSKGPN